VSDLLLRALARDGAISIRVIVGTALVREAARRHATLPVASIALGRALMGALLLAAGTKSGETTQVQLRGRGPLRGVTAIGTPEGDVRGYVKYVDLEALAGLEVGAAIGRGLLSVVRHRPGWREPYSGYVPLVSGEVAEDLAHYLNESEQTRSAVALGVDLDDEGGVRAAGGYLVQALPEASEDLLDELSERIERLEKPTQLLARGLTARDIAAEVLGTRELRACGSVPVQFACDCSVERIERAIMLLSEEDIDELLDEGKPLEVTCHFCAESYRIAPESLRERRAAAQAL